MKNEILTSIAIISIVMGIAIGVMNNICLRLELRSLQDRCIQEQVAVWSYSPEGEVKFMWLDDVFEASWHSEEL